MHERRTLLNTGDQSGKLKWCATKKPQAVTGEQELNIKMKPETQN